jgi:hypothetical protein
MRPSRESLIIAGLCIADLVSTIVLLQHHDASEGNVVMAFYLKYGWLAFVGVKCLLFVPALFIAEWYRRHNPRLVTGTLRLVIVLYVGLYSAGVFTLNRDARLERLHAIPDWDAPSIQSPMQPTAQAS